jgi:hypothetical protein
MKKSHNYVGNVFGRLTILKKNKAVTLAKGRPSWDCVCSCGGVKTGANQYELVSGGIKSCGCLQKELATQNRSVRVDGTEDTPPYAFSKGAGNFYRVWKGIKERCYRPNDQSFHNYGGRGINMHPDWKSSYRAFAVAVGPRPSLLHSIDRIDTNKDYEPGNMKWSTNKEQSNNRRTNVWLQWNGESVTLMQLAELEQVNYNLLHKLLQGCCLPLGDIVAKAKKSRQRFSPRIRSRAKPKYPDDFC